MFHRVPRTLARTGALAGVLILACSACLATAQDPDNNTVVDHAGKTTVLFRRRTSIRSRRDLDLEDRPVPRLPSRGSLRSMPRARGGELSDAFFQGISDLSRRLGCEPRDLLAVMMRESSLRADAHNRDSNAVGLVQFLPYTLARLGWTGTPQEFAELSAEEQLPWVEKLLWPFRRCKLNSAGRIYQAVFMPCSFHSIGGEDTIVIDSHGVFANSYERNRGLDSDGDGRITVGELQQAVERSCRLSAWKTIEARLDAAIHGPDIVREDRLQPKQVRAANDQPAARRRLTARATHADSGAENDRDRTPENSDAGAASMDLRTQAGLTDALETLGFDLRECSLTDALRAFQRRAGLTADGIAGAKTRAALAAELDSAL